MVLIQETHWRGSWQFSKRSWHIISSGSQEERGAGVLVMVHQSLCQAKDLRFNEVMPGRLLHVRIPGAETSMDVLSFYQILSLRVALKRDRQQQQRAAKSCDTQAQSNLEFTSATEQFPHCRRLQHATTDRSQACWSLHDFRVPHRSQRFDRLAADVNSTNWWQPTHGPSENRRLTCKAILFAKLTSCLLGPHSHRVQRRAALLTGNLR